MGFGQVHMKSFFGSGDSRFALLDLLSIARSSLVLTTVHPTMLESATVLVMQRSYLQPRRDMYTCPKRNKKTAPSELCKGGFGCVVVHPTGLEPVTFGFGGQRSIQLSYGCITMKLSS